MVTNLGGHITQNVVYIPYGEVFVEERNGSWTSPYLFNAKELDEETGLYYYGARYLNPSIVLWLSTDPLQGKYPGMSPYNYCAGNPVKLVDPDGREWIRNKETNEISWDNDCTSEQKTPEDCEYIGPVHSGLTVINFEPFYNGRSKGLSITLCYNDNKKDIEYQWIQSVKTNYKDEPGYVFGHIEEYLDCDNSKINPFYFSAENQKEFTSYDDCTYGFTDRPARASSATGAFWEGELTLVQKTENGYKPILTVSYGFINDRNKGLKLDNIKFQEQSLFQQDVLEKFNKDFNEEAK